MADMIDLVEAKLPAAVPRNPSLVPVFITCDPARDTPPVLRPYFDSALEAFGPKRLMIGTDWPVCLLACPYQRWIETVREWAGSLTEGEQADLFQNAAIQAYGL